MNATKTCSFSRSYSVFVHLVLAVFLLLVVAGRSDAVSFNVSGTFSDTATINTTPNLVDQFIGGSFQGFFKTHESLPTSYPPTSWVDFIEWQVLIMDSDGNIGFVFSSTSDYYDATFFPANFFGAYDIITLGTVVSGDDFVLQILFDPGFDGNGDIISTQQTQSKLFHRELYYPGAITYASVDVISGNSTIVPEPGTMFLLGSGLVGLAGYGRRKKR